MKFFIVFVFGFLLMGLIFRIVFNYGIGALCIAVAWLGSKIWGDEPPNFLTVVVGTTFLFLMQAFVILWWDACAVTVTINAMSRESVQYPWLYGVCGLVLTLMPLNIMEDKEELLARLDGKAPDSFMLLALIGFLVFFLNRSTMNAGFGWFLNWFG